MHMRFSTLLPYVATITALLSALYLARHNTTLHPSTLRHSLIRPFTTRMSHPELNTWTREHLTRLYTASSDEEAEVRFEGTMAQDVKLTVNGEETTWEKAKETVRALRGAAVSTRVEFGELKKDVAVKGSPEGGAVEVR